jgi:hypothetical protein
MAYEYKHTGQHEVPAANAHSPEYAMPPVLIGRTPQQEYQILDRVAESLDPAYQSIHGATAELRYAAAANCYDVIRSQPDFFTFGRMVGEGASARVTAYGRYALTESVEPTAAGRAAAVAERAADLSHGGRAVHPNLQQLVAYNAAESATEHAVISELMPGTPGHKTPAATVAGLTEQDLEQALQLCEASQAAGLVFDTGTDNHLISLESGICVVDYTYERGSQWQSLGFKIAGVAAALADASLERSRLQYPHDGISFDAIIADAELRIEALQHFGQIVHDRYAGQDDAVFAVANRVIDGAVARHARSVAYYQNHQYADDMHDLQARYRSTIRHPET